MAFVWKQSCCSYCLVRKKSGEQACCIVSFLLAEVGKNKYMKLGLPLGDNLVSSLSICLSEVFSGKWYLVDEVFISESFVEHVLNYVSCQLSLSLLSAL